MKGYHHFVTGDFKSHAKWVSKKEYGMIRDNVVRTCVDCILINKGKMLLGKRNIEPHPDWWIFGGKMKPGENFEQAAKRNLKRELNLDIKLSRFHHFGTYSFVWSRRAELPQENGCHDVSITMILEISDEEVKKIKQNYEYEEVEWYDPEVVAESGNFHPAVVTYANDLLVYLKQ